MRKSTAPPTLQLATRQDLDKYRGDDFMPLYSTSVKVTGGDAAHGAIWGTARSDDGNLTLELRLPPALGGPGGGTNSEQLFAAGLAACFHSALTMLASRERIALGDVGVNVTVAYGRDPVDGLYTLQVQVRVNLPDLPRPMAEELTRNAERVCPYAKMARQGIVCIVALESPARPAP